MSDIELFTEKLWDLVDNWQDLAANKVIQVPFLADHPRTAHSQALNKAAGELSKLLLEWDFTNGGTQSLDGPPG